MPTPGSGAPQNGEGRVWRIRHSITKTFHHISYVRIPDVKQKVKKSLNLGNFVFRWGLSCLGYFLIGIFDPFGVVENADHFSSSIFYRVYAPYYPDKPHDPYTSFERISVVLLTDTDLKVLDETWPATYEFHADILDAIREQNPTAVMVDIGFLDERGGDFDEGRSGIYEACDDWEGWADELDEGDDEHPLLPLLKTIKAYNEKNIPLYFAASDKTPEGFTCRVRQDLARRAELVAVPPARGESRSLAYPLVYNETKHQTAAAAMYMADGRGGRTLSDEPMEIVWATRTESFDSTGPFRCKPLSDVWWKQWFHHFRSYFIFRIRSILGEEVRREDRPYSRVRQSCPPHRTLLASEVYVNADDPSIISLLEDHFVFYGVYLSMVDDLVEPPTHELIPAVYFHAMALDNLLVWGDKVIRTERSSPVGDIGTWISVITVMILLLVTEFTFTMLDRNSRKTNRQLKKLGIWVCGFLTIMAIVVGSSGISFFFFRLSPFNFVGFFGWEGFRLLPVLFDYFRSLFPSDTAPVTDKSSQ